MSGHGYGNLHRDFGWSVGVHKAPAGYQHPWLAIGKHGTAGAWTREQARGIRGLQRLDEVAS